MEALAVGSVQPRHVSAWLAYLVEAEQSQGSVKRYRASLSSFFAWCVENKRILVNLVTGVRVPSATEPADEMNPYTEDELAACLWLARGVDVGIVKAWMGHASIATTNIYLHHLGTVADSAALSLLNKPRPGDPETSNRARGYYGGTKSAER